MPGFHRNEILEFNYYNQDAASRLKSSEYSAIYSSEEKECSKGVKGKVCRKNKKKRSTRKKLGSIGNNKTGLQATLPGNEFFKVR